MNDQQMSDRAKQLEELNTELDKLYNSCLRVSGLTINAINRNTKIYDLEQEVSDLKCINGEAQVALEEYEKLYNDACDYTGKQARELSNRAFEIRELQKENVQHIYKIRVLEQEVFTLKNIRVENKPPTMEQALKQLRESMDAHRVVNDELLAKYGSHKAIEAAGVWDMPEYKDYGFNYVDELKDIYEEFMPIVFR